MHDDTHDGNFYVPSKQQEKRSKMIRAFQLLAVRARYIPRWMTEKQGWDGISLAADTFLWSGSLPAVGFITAQEESLSRLRLHPQQQGPHHSVVLQQRVPLVPVGNNKKPMPHNNSN
jgi:hypothetical protein